MKKSLFGKKKKLNSDMALQITSMADVFMILLVFLLKNYSSSIATIAPAGKTKLPIAEAKAPAKETLKLEISPDSILIDEKPILTLKDFAYDAQDVVVAGGADKLKEALMEQRQKNPEKSKEAHLMLIADEKAPYETIQRVLASAASSGFVDLQLVVVQKD